MYSGVSCITDFHVLPKCDLAVKKKKNPKCWNTLLRSPSVSHFLSSTIPRSSKKQRTESDNGQFEPVSFNFLSSSLADLLCSHSLSSDYSKFQNVPWTERLKSPVWINGMTNRIKIDELNKEHSSIHHGYWDALERSTESAPAPVELLSGRQ